MHSFAPFSNLNFFVKNAESFADFLNRILQNLPDFVEFLLSRSPWRASIQPIGTDLSDRAAGQKKDPGRSEKQQENGSAATGKLREIGKRKAAE